MNSNVHWIKKQNPTDLLDTRKFKIVEMMNSHIKYCPVENEGEIHIIRLGDFRKGFDQSPKD